jgi:hypothetical protein
MATLADQRRAIRDGITASRQATGEAERKAIGKRLEAERRGTAVVEDLNRLQPPATQRRTLRPVPPLGALPASSGRGDYKPPANTNPGGGIASPLTEPDYSAREWWPSGLPSSDGLFILPALKKVVLQDANSAEVIIEYAGPTP